MTKTYLEAIALPTFEERFNYLKLSGSVAHETFGTYRWLNQILYTSREWKELRSQIILRDDSCDLACPDRKLFSQVYIHHINPITLDDVRNRSSIIFDPNNLICVSYDTHQALHYGDLNLLVSSEPIVRTKHDTAPWRLT